MVKAKKTLGQNFLTETTVINQIIKSIHPLSHDNFLEIGPGRGAITKPLLKLIKNLHAVEIDKDLLQDCLLYTSPSPRDRQKSRMPSSA